MDSYFEVVGDANPVILDGSNLTKTPTNLETAKNSLEAYSELALMGINAHLERLELEEEGFI